MKKLRKWVEDLSDNWHIQNIGCGLLIMILIISISEWIMGVINILTIGWTGIWYQWVTVIISTVVAAWVIGLSMRS